MARRKELIVNNETYHIFNKNIGKEAFLNKSDLIRAESLTNFYSFNQSLGYSDYKKLSKEAKEAYRNRADIKRVVEIYAYALMPNHFHFVLKQLSDNGISNFIRKWQNSYAKYYNIKHEREGSLFLHSFKSKRIPSEELLLHVTRYVHLNPVTSYLVELENINDYSWTSFKYYTGSEIKYPDLINTKLITSLTGSRQKYLKFVKNNADYQRKLHKIKNMLFY